MRWHDNLDSKRAKVVSSECSASACQDFFVRTAQKQNFRQPISARASNCGETYYCTKTVVVRLRELLRAFKGLANTLSGSRISRAERHDSKSLKHQVGTRRRRGNIGNRCSGQAHSRAIFGRTNARDTRDERPPASADLTIDRDQQSALSHS